MFGGSNNIELFSAPTCIGALAAADWSYQSCVEQHEATHTNPMAQEERRIPNPTNRTAETSSAITLEPSDGKYHHHTITKTPLTDNTVQDEPTWSISTPRGLPTSAKIEFNRAGRALHEYPIFVTIR